MSKASKEKEQPTAAEAEAAAKAQADEAARVSRLAFLTGKSDREKPRRRRDSAPSQG